MRSLVRVRYAPSPTGTLHVGGLRTALINWLFAKKHGGRFLLRIEDTDVARVVPGAAEALEETLARFGIRSDEPAERQSRRLSLYKNAADALLAKGDAYPCFCSKDRLEVVRRRNRTEGREAAAYDRRCRGIDPDESKRRVEAGEEHVLRLKAPRTGKTNVEDIVRGIVSFENKVMDDQILLKTDGFPTYHLASVVDDHDMNISHVIRGEEWLSSTPKHLTLYKMLGWEPPAFAHLSLLLNKDGTKMSKRNEASSADLLLSRHGYSPMAIANFIALLGWNPLQQKSQSLEELALMDNDETSKKEQLIFTSLESLAEAFELDKTTRKKGAIVDLDFLHWINGEHFRRKDRNDVVRSLKGQLGFELSPDFSDKYLREVVELMLFRVFQEKDLVAFCGHFLVPAGQTDLLPEFSKVDKIKLDSEHPLSPTICKEAAEILSKIPDDDWNTKSIKKQLKHLAQSLNTSHGLKTPQVMLPIRATTTRSFVGSSLPETLSLLGKERTLERLLLDERKERSPTPEVN